MSKQLTFSKKEIENRIFIFRDTQVMLDRDLAEMFRFRLSLIEFEHWKSQIVMSNEVKMVCIF